jgi:hypothetical protein
MILQRVGDAGFGSAISSPSAKFLNDVLMMLLWSIILS